MLDFINIVTDQQIPRITGNALGSKGFEMSPIMLQGDSGPIENNNIIDTPSK